MLHRLLLLVCLLGLLPAARPLHAAPPPPSDSPIPTAVGVPPLPRSCIGGAPLNDFAEAICCVSGYVYMNGVPVANAEVTITVAGRSLVTRTQSGAGSTMPYYSASLNAEPLDAQPGDSVTITATAGGQTQSRTFIAQEGGRQEDVVLPQIAIESTWAAAGRADPSFKAAAMAYDAARQRLILFGGLERQGNNDVPLAETWAWDGRSWIRLAPMMAPSARSDHAMVYDVARQRIVLFGGTGAGGVALTDTWEWDGTSWQERKGVTAPAVSGRSLMVYDTTRARSLLVAADAANPTQFSVWSWDGTSWARQPAQITAPARTGFNLAYDAKRDRLVLFGGIRTSVLQQDLWEYDGNTWARAYPRTGPSARSGHAMTYDLVRQQVLLTGGLDATGKPLEDTWAWNGTAWAELRVDLPPRAGSLLVYDSTRNLPILAGGYSDATATTYPGETWELDMIDWNQRGPRVSPEFGAFSSFDMAYDLMRKRVLFFGGSTNVSDHVETWEWDGVSWTRRTPKVTPPTRVDFAIAYDEVRGQVILFGGRGYGGGYLNDTWAWDGTIWTQLSPLNTPSVRSDHIMAYDAARQQIVLFGGWNPDENLKFRETWIWDGTTWSNLNPSISPYSSFGKMTYDNERQKIIFLSSGIIWEWDGINWSQRITQSPADMITSSYMQIGYDGVQKRSIAFGGSPSVYIYPRDTWQWDGTVWTKLNLAISPPGRYKHTMTYDPLRQRLVLFGGVINTGTLRDTWEWDGTTWREQSGDINMPGAFSAAAMDYSSTGLSLLFGGRATDGSLSGRTFHWQGSRWVQLDPATVPPPRQLHQIARNSDGSRLLMFGGAGAGGAALDDTWLWDGSDWRLQAPTSRPPARSAHSLTFDTRRGVWVLFGGASAGGAYLADTWEYDGTTWRQISPAGAPPARIGATLTYDQRRGVTVLVGGQHAAGLLADVWEYDGTTWTNVTPMQPIAARMGHSAVYDSHQGVVVVAGGRDDAGVRNDTWEWDGTTWRERIATTPLSARLRMATAYDAYRGELIAFGGETDAGVPLGDTQLHRANGTLMRPMPIATINRILPRDARQGTDTISFEGSGADTDSSNVITSYRWSIGGTVISTARTFSMPAADLPLGAQTIRFEVQDDEGDWSSAIEQTIYIRNSSGAVATDTSWTLLIYAVGDNNLAPWMGENAEMDGMLYRLQRAGPQPNVQVAILYDGPTANDTYRYTLSSDGVWIKTPQPEARMNEMATLRDFILWGQRGSGLPPTDHYALAIVDHANGIVGIGQDDTSLSDENPFPFLTPLDVRVALLEATDDGARKIDVVQYDGCSFGLFENTAIAAGLTNFVIASANTGWGIFDYAAYRRLAAQSASPRAFALSVAQRYAERVNAEQLPYTIAVFDMAHFEALNTAISGFGQSLLTYVQADLSTRRTLLRNARQTMQKYESGQGILFEPDNEDSYVDLVDLAQKIKAAITDSAVQSAADQVLAQALLFVAYESHATGFFNYVDPFRGGERIYHIRLDNAHGLGIYYPPRSSTNPNSAYKSYVEHQLFSNTRDNGWTRFLGQGLPPQLAGDLPGLPNDSLMAPLFMPENMQAATMEYRVFLPVVQR